MTIYIYIYICDIVICVHVYNKIITISPSIRHSCTIHYQLSYIHYSPSTINNQQLSTTIRNSPLFTYPLSTTIHNPPSSTIHNPPPSTIYYSPSTTITIHHSPLSTIYHYPPFTIHLTRCSHDTCCTLDPCQCI